MIESVSKRAFGGSSGTYNVHALELAAARERKSKTLGVTVKFLDDSERVFRLEKRAKGSDLLERVFDHLELIEKDYFGLRCCDNDSQCLSCMRWLDPSKLVKKQLGTRQHVLYFRVKFYVSDPSKLQEEYTRYQFYLQLRRDILEGKLHLPPSTAILLASYTVQSELGDYQPEEHEVNYLSDMCLIPNQTEDLERKITELHKLHKGQSPADAEFNFLDHAKRLEMYGVELHKARDNTDREIRLGVTHSGLVVFQNNVRINVFSWSKIMKISFKRKQFFIQLRREPSESYDTLLGFNMETYRSSKTLWKSSVEHHTFFRLHSPRARRRFPFSLGSKFSYSGRTEYQTLAEARRRSGLERKFVRSSSRNLSSPAIRSSTVEDKTKCTRTSGSYAHKVTSLDTKEPKKAWTEDTRIPDEDSCYADKPAEGPFSPGIAGRIMSYADDEEAPASPTSNGLYDTPPYSPSHSPATARSPADVDAVTVAIRPDADGKYGFNVKGGDGAEAAVLVSRVAPGTPAGESVPRLTEGDRLLRINGKDVSRARHEEVVELIQEARRSDSGKLVLVVKPSAYQAYEGDFEEPPYQYVPVGGAEPPSPGNALQQSMLLLADGLASGALIAQYETLFRKHPDLTSNESLKADNVNKNRYRDILPYDTTRVVLKTVDNGSDYINANFIDMSISNTDVTNRYIATQGPLSTTVEEFWSMVLQEDSNLIVMLTTLIEKGRSKCHKYWPDLDGILTLKDIIVKCVKEEIDQSESFVFRDFVVVDVKDNVSKEIKHMQYVAWPDHGVPDSPVEFLAFTERVRANRAEGSPVVVHCSAGIGRTGVMVLMETALCLMEAGEPVYPLEIVKTMREQRAMMIQNASQYRFVCESVFAAYEDKVNEKAES
ncbi:unnamed protein product [Phyllotreta striolata]|uniref:protein-tyrosine-phosphatase n=1 Tax=Phyllotreta striolata TaxID=444603 RepID=A0A9N9XT43_PHYSR|nr:unnamed protein product [Phyllotreta striolata]